MAQAKVFSSTELRRVLDYVATRQHAERNRAIVLLSHSAGMRCKEIAALRYCDVLHSSGAVKDEIYLSAEQTKGRYSRTVYLGSKLQKELAAYVKAVPPTSPQAVLFATQKEATRGFTANTLAQFFLSLYRKVGIEGASSHSGRRSYLTNLANKGTSIHILKTLAGHRSISTTAVYLYSSPSQLKAAAELA
ncbi:site-specific integrase [Azonexus fungiphilus]|nr:site-specific integrase [Azonexus fungiphilus]